MNVTIDDIKEYFRNYYIKNYFGNFNAEDVKDRVEELVKQTMENKEYVKSVYDLLYDEKLTELLRSKLNIDHQEGDIEAYVAMLTERQKGKTEEAKETPKKKSTKKAAADTDKTEEAPKAKKTTRKTTKKDNE